MLIFKGSQVIKYYVMFAFLFVQTVLLHGLIRPVKFATTIASFKHMLAQNNPKIPDFYFNGERKLQILHTRLRPEWCSLNEHLFGRNLVMSPNCICGEIESNRHFLPSCASYNLIR